MSKHVKETGSTGLAPRLKAGLKSTRVRAALALGTGAAVAITGTMASWSDTATVEGLSIGTGSLDVQVSGTSGSGYADSIANYTGLNITGLGPGGSTAGLLSLKNTGTAPLNASIVGAFGTGEAGVNSKLTIKVFKGGTPGAGTGARTCTGGTQVGTDAVGFSDLATPAAGLTILAGATQDVCIQATLAADTPSAMQTKTMTASLTVNAAS